MTITEKIEKFLNENIAESTVTDKSALHFIENAEITLGKKLDIEKRKEIQNEISIFLSKGGSGNNARFIATKYINKYGK